MSANFNTICSLLGAENEKRLKDEIIKVIVERVEDDLTDWHEYLFDYDRMFQEIEDEIAAEIKVEIKAKIHERIMVKIDEKVDAIYNSVI